METEARKLDRTTIKQWLSSDVTLKLPGWAYLAAAVCALALVVLALD